MDTFLDSLKKFDKEHIPEACLKAAHGNGLGHPHGVAQVSSCREHIMFRPCVVSNLLPPVPGCTPHGPKGSLCLLGAGQVLGSTEKAGPQSQQRQESGRHLDLSHQGIKVKHDPKLRGAYHPVSQPLVDLALNGVR